MTKEKTGRLLVVDDEIETLTPLCEFLSEWGYEVNRFTSGKEALDAMKKQAFDVLLADLVMPEMDGIELIKEAIKIEPLFVCIIITGHGTIQTAVEAMKIGAFDYVLKPIEWKMLRPIISRAMETRRLRESEKQYRAIVEDQTELICRWKPGEILTFVNETYCRYFNKKSEELIGQSFMSLIPEEEHEKVCLHFASLTQENPVSTHEHRVLCPDGTTRWQQWTNRAIFDSQGNIIEYQSVGRDITESKNKEEALKKEQYILRELFEYFPLSVYNITFDGKIADCNNIAVSTLGYDNKDELIGKPLISTVYAPSSREKAKQLFEKWKLWKKLKNEELQIITKQGEIKDVLLNVDTIYDPKGTPLYSLSTHLDITERKKAEKKLRESEAKYRDLYDNAPDMYHTIDRNGIIVECNETGVKMLGYTKEEIIGKHITDFFTERSKKYFNEDFPKLKKYKKLLNLNREFIRKDGSTFLTILNVFSEYDKDGEFSGTRAIARDITQLKQAEIALKASEEKYRLHFEYANDVIVSMDTNGVIINISPSLEKILGYKPEELIGVSFQNAGIITSGSLKDAVSDFLRVLAGETVFMSIYEFIAKDGVSVFGETSSAPLFRDGKVVGVVSIARDITDRRKAEQALKDRENRLKSIFRSAPIGIGVVSSPDRIIMDVNDEMCKMLGYHKHELVGKNALIIYPSDKEYKRVGREKYKQIEEYGVGTIETQWKRKDGRIIDVILSSSLIDHKDITKGVTFTAIDITERKHFEKELKRSHAQLRALSVRLSEVEENEKRRLAQELHDQVGQNLTALGINLNTLPTLVSIGETDKIKDRVRDAQKLLDETTRSIRSVMADLRPSVLDDYGLLSAVRWYSQKFSERTRITVKIEGNELKSRLPHFFKTTLYRIFQEALTNIAKHARASKAKISLEETKTEIKLIISDNGKGFNPETVYKKKKQTMWGLLTMKERAEAIGGKFDVQSSPGKGTKIFVELKR